MKVVRVLGIVFGALFLLIGITLLIGAAVFGTSGNEFDRQIGERGWAGPATGTVTAIDGPVLTVDYTDNDGAARTGVGPVAEGTTPPEQGDDVQVYYSTLDPRQVIILDFPGGNFAGVAGLLRMVAVVCLAIGAVLLLAGIISLVTGRRRAALPAGPTGAPAVSAPPGPPPGEADTATAGPARPDGRQAPPPPPAPGVDPMPTQPFPSDPPPPPEFNRPGG